MTTGALLAFGATAINNPKVSKDLSFLGVSPVCSQCKRKLTTANRIGINIFFILMKNINLLNQSNEKGMRAKKTVPFMLCRIAFSPNHFNVMEFFQDIVPKQTRISA